MARSEIQYIRYYSAGSAAARLELPELPKEIRKPAPKPQKAVQPKPVLVMDRMAFIGITVTVVMMLLFAAGIIHTAVINHELSRTQAQVEQLRRENETLRAQYDEMLDLEQIRIAAETMGMVPADQVPHIQVSVHVDEPVAEQTGWQSFFQRFLAFLA